MQKNLNLTDQKYYHPEKEELDLSHQDLTDQDIGNFLLPFLEDHVEIKALNLSDNSITGKGIKILTDNTSITRLDLSENTVDEVGIKALANNNTLKTLILRWNALGDKDAIALAENKSIIMLDLQSNQIGNDGAKAFANNNTILELNLGCNAIGQEGKMALAKNKTIKNLDLHGNLCDVDLYKPSWTTWGNGSKPSQAALDEFNKRNQAIVDRQARIRFFEQNYRDSHNGEIPKYILWYGNGSNEKGFVPEPEWIRLFDSLQDARKEENEAYREVDPDIEDDDTLMSGPSFEEIKKIYGDSEVFSKYEKAYYKVKNYENLVNHYPGLPTNAGYYDVIKTKESQKMINEDHKDCIFKEQEKQMSKSDDMKELIEPPLQETNDGTERIYRDYKNNEELLFFNNRNNPKVKTQEELKGYTQNQNKTKMDIHEYDFEIDENWLVLSPHWKSR